MRWGRCWSGGGPMRLRRGDGCTGRRRPGSGSAGTRYGCWPRDGRRRRWAGRWTGMPTPLANGPRHLRKAVRGRCLLSSREVPPRAERGSAGRIEGGGAGVAIASRHRPIQLELEGGAAICVGPLRVVAEPEQLSELPAPAGVCAETPQAATAQGGSGAAGSLRGRVCGADGGGPTDWGQDILR